MQKINYKIMALIKCKECGREISGKATTCPHCGCPVEKEIKCEECGAILSATDEVCPQCGCPNIQKEVPQTPDNINDQERNKQNNRLKRFLVENRDNLPKNGFQEIQQMLSGLSDEQWDNIEYISFKSPSTLLIISIFLGYLGIDRFMLGDTTNGILKILLTICCGVGLIWWLVDIFKVDKMTREHNYKLLKDTLKYV